MLALTGQGGIAQRLPTTPVHCCRSMTVLEDMNLVCTGHLDGSIVMYVLPQPEKLPPITAQESREPQLLRLESARFKVRRCAQLLCRPHGLLVRALAWI